MGYGLMHKKGKKSYYSTNTNYTTSWSDDIENAAEIVQKVNAEKAARSLYKSGFDKQIYVVYITKVPMQMTEVPMPAEKTGFCIFNIKDGTYYNGAKKPRYFGYYNNGVLQSATTFKSAKEAQSTLDTLLAEYLKTADDEDESNARRSRNDYRHNTYRDLYENAKQNYVVKEL